MQAERDEKELLYNTIIDVNRKQYAKLMTLERKEMINQKEISDTWVKFVFLLLESTLQHCQENEKLFHNMDEYAQTLLLRQQANMLRSQCNLPSYEVGNHHLSICLLIFLSLFHTETEVPLKSTVWILYSVISLYAVLLFIMVFMSYVR